jgi:uncharacterized protein (DUF4415 family)
MPKPPYRTRGTSSVLDRAEAAFKSATTRPPESVPGPPKVAPIPQAKELVSLRLDQEILEHFREGGPGWQGRINEALRKAAGK